MGEGKKELTTYLGYLLLASLVAIVLGLGIVAMFFSGCSEMMWQTATCREYSKYVTGDEYSFAQTVAMMQVDNYLDTFEVTVQVTEYDLTGNIKVVVVSDDTGMYEVGRSYFYVVPKEEILNIERGMYLNLTCKDQVNSYSMNCNGYEIQK
ncbi:MAG TPA: hypothetical protein VFI61_02505 [Patescibacteria group bacterium]|nr:hypothetical protein [Patescibacteria group bacterium]